MDIQFLVNMILNLFFVIAGFFLLDKVAMVNPQYFFHDDNSDTIERETDTFIKGFSKGLRRLNYRYNNFMAAKLEPAKTNSWVHFHYMLSTLDDDVEYTPTTFFRMLESCMNEYNEYLIRYFTATNQISDIVSGHGQILLELKHLTNVVGLKDASYSYAKFKVSDVMRAIEENDLLKIEDKKILDPHYHYAVTKDNKTYPIYSDLKKYCAA